MRLFVLPAGILLTLASAGIADTPAPGWEFIFKTDMGIDYEVDLASIRRTGSAATVQVRARGGTDPGFWNGSDSYESLDQLDCAKGTVTALRTVFKNGKKVMLTKPRQRPYVAKPDTAGRAIVDAACGHGSDPSLPTGTPPPKLQFAGTETFQNGGQTFVRYKLGVANAAAYAADLFTASPDLPPCGRNANASRTWVDIFDDGGTRLNGFCALQQPRDLGSLWFALPQSGSPPSAVYIEMKDRRSGKTYRSSVAVIPAGSAPEGQAQ